MSRNPPADPDDTLDEIREITQRTPLSTADAQRLVDLAVDLDESLSAGGDLPDDWQDEDEEEEDEEGDDE